MDKKAIGVIDSGVGGLTVLHELMRQLPQERFLYVGDTLRCPYGSKSKNQVREYIFEIVDYLKRKDIKALIIACNTATAYVLEELQLKLSIPVIGVIKPGARASVKVTKNKKIGVIGTEGTVQSKAYLNALYNIDPTLNVYSLSCPDFVPMIEKGIIEGSTAKRIIYETLNPLFNTDIDTLILGCTHYPIIKKSIQSIMGPKVKIVSSGEETARETSSMIDTLGLSDINWFNEHFNHEFFATGELEDFEKITRIIFNENLHNLKQVKFGKAVFN